MEHIIELGNSLSQALSRRFRIGRLWSLVPDDMPLPDVMVGWPPGSIGQRLGPWGALDVALSDLLSRHGGLLIAEDSSARRDDPAVLRARNKAVHDREVYWVTANASVQRVRRVIANSRSWRHLSVWAYPDPIGPRRDLSTADLDRIAMAAQILVVGAFDGDGWVVCERAGDLRSAYLYERMVHEQGAGARAGMTDARPARLARGGTSLPDPVPRATLPVRET